MESETPLAAPSSANGVAGSARPARPVSDEKFGGPIEDSGSHMTHCWREMDSNHRSPVRTAFPAEIVRRCVGLVLTLR